jgi:hypothetical protein
MEPLHGKISLMMDVSIINGIAPRFKPLKGRDSV